MADDPIALLLRDSLAAHDAAQQLRRVRQPRAARVKLAEAARLRREAQAADPDHRAVAWDSEQIRTPRGRDTHRDLLVFYDRQGV